MDIQERITALENQLKQLEHNRSIANVDGNKQEIKQIDLQVDSIHQQIANLYSML